MKTVITIGREYGSGGRLVAKKLSEALDIPFYDKEVIQGVVKKTGFAENFVRDAERRPTNSFIYDLYFSAQSLSTQDQVFIAQSGVIKDLASKGGCVIVGRCADYILRENPDLLRVFVYAPMEERIRREHLEDIREEKRTMVFYEAPHKLLRTLEDFYKTLGERPIALVREITKVHEQVWRTTLSEAIAHYTEEPPRGEFVLILGGKQEEEEKEPAIDPMDRVGELLEEGLSISLAVKQTAKELGVPKNSIYNEALERFSQKE